MKIQKKWSLLLSNILQYYSEEIAAELFKDIDAIIEETPYGVYISKEAYGRLKEKYNI